LNEEKENAANTHKIKRLSVSLSETDIEKLEELSKSQGITLNEAIRKAIATEHYIQKAIQDKSKILIKREDGSQVEIVFR
jgi:metal-responsive CopG/Arc/MetJ family transcriptional regulator